MLKSTLMRQLCAVLIAVVLLTALSTWLVYTTMTTNQILKLRAAELIPRAQSFAATASKYLDGDIDRTQLMLILRQRERLSAEALLMDTQGTELICTEGKRSIQDETVREQLPSALGGSLTTTTHRLGRSSYMLLVSLPVRDEGDNIRGALLLYARVNDVQAALSMLTPPLLLALGAVVLVVFALAFMLAHRIVRPLSQMRDVSQRMSEGRFDLLADEHALGEVGQLGASLNRMSAALKKSISDLTFERNRLLQLLNTMSEGILAVDSRGKFTHINAALENLFPPVENETDVRLSLINEPKVWEAMDNAISTGEEGNFLVNRDGKIIRCIITPVHETETQIAGALGVFRDITQYLRLENTRREYVANVSHEMRTPLTAVQGLVEPLRDGLVKDEDKRQRYYEIILREIKRLSRLINDVMELSRLQSGNEFIKTHVFKPGPLVKDLCERYSAIAEEKGLQLKTDCDFDALPKVDSNPDRIEQLLVILLDNAIKYTAEGSVTVGACVKPDSVIFRVRDTGRGISKENQQYIFDRFYKVDKAHSGLGSGLGLSIAREVLAAMGESIWVCSQEGKGSEFAFTVKRAGEEKTDGGDE
ncbi:MAG: HAMP domain-containing protein, partial [Clostridia bacterium]|nr:HAMP domain-containing protein [Clostridia bacterium]